MSLFKNLFGGNKRPDLEDEFLASMQTQAFELMGQGVDPVEVPRIATNRVAEQMMAKYRLPLESMINIIERAMQRKR